MDSELPTPPPEAIPTGTRVEIRVREAVSVYICLSKRGAKLSDNNCESGTVSSQSGSSLDKLAL